MVRNVVRTVIVTAFAAKLEFQTTSDGRRYVYYGVRTVRSPNVTMSAAGAGDADSAMEAEDLATHLTLLDEGKMAAAA